MEFKDRIKQIENVEKDVDQVLKAARLERNPEDHRRKLELIFTYVTGIIAMILGSAIIIIFMLILAMGR